MDTHDIETSDAGTVLGNTAQVQFVSLGNRTVEGKVDTGATTSSLHATNISVNEQQRKVSFRSEELSENLITLDLAGVQEVHSADGGGKSRPIVEMDVTINGTSLRSVSFNLNDRSNMDAMVLIGQNILQAGKFTIDPSKGTEQTQDAPTNYAPNESAILNAIEALVENGVTLADIVKYLHTAAVNRIKD